VAHRSVLFDNPEPVHYCWIKIQRRTVVVHLGTGQGLTGVVEKNSSTAGLGGEEAEVDGEEAERRRRVDSSSSHRCLLQRWPESSDSWRNGFPELR
jgi:hypothetical protein